MAGSNSDWNWGSSEQALNKIRSLVRAIPDFPKPGILFQDIMPIFKDASVVNAMIDLMVAYIEINHPEVDAIVGLDARGFLIGPMIACHLQKSFIPVRKQGKLPGKCLSAASVKEYGEDVLEIQADALKPGEKVVIIDDLLATGGTLSASCQLMKAAGVEVLGCVCLIELVELKGKEKVPAPFHAFLQY